MKNNWGEDITRGEDKVTRVKGHEIRGARNDRRYVTLSVVAKGFTFTGSVPTLMLAHLGDAAELYSSIAHRLLIFSHQQHQLSPCVPQDRFWCVLEQPPSCMKEQAERRTHLELWLSSWEMSSTMSFSDAS